MSFRIKVHATGSHGNCMVVETGKTRIMIDAGLHPNRMEGKMTDIDIVLLTHDHGDHNKYAGELSSKYERKVAGSRGTLDNTPNLKRRNMVYMEPYKSYRIKDAIIVTFPVLHDASEPFGYMIINSLKEKLAFIPECGEFTKFIKEKLKADYYILEANYSRDFMQRAYDNGEIDRTLYNRIFSPVGHTAVEDAIEYAKKRPNNKFVFHHTSSSRFGELEIPRNCQIATNQCQYSFGEEIPY